jgi:hypothetical protein
VASASNEKVVVSPLPAGTDRRQRQYKRDLAFSRVGMTRKSLQRAGRAWIAPELLGKRLRRGGRGATMTSKKRERANSKALKKGCSRGEGSRKKLAEAFLGDLDRS